MVELTRRHRDVEFAVRRQFDIEAYFTTPQAVERRDELLQYK